MYTNADTTYTMQLPLPGDGCYAFTIYDYYGDGLGVRHYKIIGPGGVVIVEGNEFPFSEHHLIGVENSAISIANNGAIDGIIGLPEEFCGDVDYTFSFALLNLGMESIHQAEIELLDDGNVLEVIEWTGEVLPGNTVLIPVTPTTLE